MQPTQEKCRVESGRDMLFKKDITSFEQVFKEFDMTLLQFVNSRDERYNYEENQERWKNRGMYVLSIAVALIEDFLNFKNRANSMNAEQIGRTASMLLKGYTKLTLNDLRYFHNLIIDGYFGKVYDLDGQYFLIAMRQYWQEREIAYGEYVGKIIADNERKKREERERDIAEHPDDFYGIPESTQKVFEEMKKQLMSQKYAFQESNL